MKKFFLAFMAISLLVVLAACDNNPADDDPGVQKADDPEAPITEQALEDKQELATMLGIDIDVAEKYSPDRYSVIETDQAQVDFSVGDSMAFGRMALGQRENMSGYTSTFDFDEQTEISGLPARLRYPDPDAEVTAFSGKIGIADVWDAEKDVTYLVVIFTNPTKAQLIEAMESLIKNSDVVEVQNPEAEGGADGAADQAPPAE